MISRVLRLLFVLTFPLLAQGSKEDYQRADELGKRFSGKVFRDRVDPQWIEDTGQFWYRVRTGPKTEKYVLIDPATGARKEADSLDQLLPKQNKPSKNGSNVKILPTPRTHKNTGDSTTISFLNKTRQPVRFLWLGNLNSPTPYGKVEPGKQIDQHTYAGHVWIVKGPNNKTLGVFEATAKPGLAVIDGSWKPSKVKKEQPKRRPRSNTSPDGKWRVEIKNHNLSLTDLASKKTITLSKSGTKDDPFTGQVHWSPDSAKLVAIQRKTADKRQVHIVESSPKDQAQPKLKTITYVKPGDPIDHPRPHLFDIPAQKEIPLDDKLFENPWSISDFRWDDDSSQFTFLYNQRGHQVLRIVAISKSGEISSLIEDSPETFVCYSSKRYYHRIDEKKEIIWMSERDGWNHLYLFDSKTGSLKNQITKGNWVVRKVDRVDHEKRQIWFQAGGIHPAQDPYHIHYARINFDGTNLVKLTTSDGTHNIDYSPDEKYLIASYSRVDLPPVTELRRTEDGSLVTVLEKADHSELIKAGWKAPERFVAKGRDGKTDIYGIIRRPSNFDPGKKYPVIEQIYAGPHGAHVPKRFSSRAHVMAELGFIVVQVDGMGTSHRSKAFHDVCWQNIGDAGFPDRVLWIKAAAKDRPWMDLSRVGIYGGSAGGQNAMRALIAHNDFYHVAVADCGCHDNAMDKIWWNEQWMGYPLGEHYKASSNTHQAHRLKGKLLLIVGELDTNVDPASTMQVVNALIKADKDFDLLVIPGVGHGAASSPYGRRRQKDYFVRHLLGVEPRH